VTVSNDSRTDLGAVNAKMVEERHDYQQLTNLVLTRTILLRC
jgi:hypothetical protein